MFQSLNFVIFCDRGIRRKILRLAATSRSFSSSSRWTSPPATSHQSAPAPGVDIQQMITEPLAAFPEPLH